MLLSLVFLLASLLQPHPPVADLQLVFQLGDNANRGTLMVALFESEDNFENDTPTYSTTQAVAGSGGEIRISIPDVAAGTYAVAAYHDRNNNEKLDRNLFGVPTEAYGFINEPASKWRAPRWEEISIAIADQDQEIQIELKKWSDR